MRFSAVAALCTAPLALASSLQAELVARGAVSPEVQAIGGAKANGGGSGTNVVVQQAGVGAVSSTEIIIIWVNNGGGAATTTMNQPQSVIASSTISAATHQVTVGGNAGLVYTPDNVAANVGDMVVFTFLSQNHTATQSAFATPCEALAGGMDSGFMPNINGSVSPAPQMAMQVTVATPLWFYCKQKGHCGKGMTFSINPQTGSGNKTQAAFQQLAIQQNGTGSTAVIAGGAGASSTAAAPVSVATSSAVAVAPAAGTMAAGTGTINANGACACSCLCGTAAFPNAAVQGLGGFGGMSGAMPMSALEISVSTS